MEIKEKTINNQEQDNKLTENLDRLDILLKEIDTFNKDRDWDQFHSSSNLSKSICIEACELLEVFQWDDENYSKDKIKEELADVMLYCLQLCLKENLDPIEIMSKKMELNGKKYPVEKSKGSNKKYDEL